MIQIQLHGPARERSPATLTRTKTSYLCSWFTALCGRAGVAPRIRRRLRQPQSLDRHSRIRLLLIDFPKRRLSICELPRVVFKGCPRSQRRPLALQIYLSPPRPDSQPHSIPSDSTQRRLNLGQNPRYGFNYCVCRHSTAPTAHPNPSQRQCLSLDPDSQHFTLPMSRPP